MTGHATDHTRELLRRGFAALSAGRLREAGACCREVLAREPDSPPGHFLVGLVSLELGERATAVNAFGSVTRLEPAHAAAWAQLARLFVRAGQPNRADEALARAVEHVKEEPVVWDVIGTVYSQLGDQRSARTWYARAVAAEPRHPGFVVNLASACVFLGDADEAERLLTGLLQVHPGNAQAHWLLAGARRAKDRSHIEEMVRQVAAGNRTAQEFAFLYYGLGKELEDLGEWDRAFEAFSRGAKARRSLVDYREQDEIRAYETLERLYTPEWLAGRGPGADSPAPIFVVGLPRTGTTLVERILTSHSRVSSAGELQQFGLSIRRLLDGAPPGRFSAALFEKAAEVDPEALGRGYLEVTRRFQEPGGHYVDKLPSNYLYLPLILAALPNARVVHLVRDPMDACFASYKQLFADAYLHSYDQAEMARHFARYHRLVGIWRERFPGRFHDVRYEDLVRDLEPHARALIGYLGLPWEDACLSFHEQSGAVATASAAQVREPAHTRSVGRWRRYEARLQPMREALEAAGIDTGQLTDT